MTGYFAAGAAVLLALTVIAVERRRSIQTIRRLEEMLTAAMNGSFIEETFDESRLSALESRLARYLAASSVSAWKIQKQKDQISALISDISHQTKTPVANLQLYAQLLAEQPLTPQGAECVRVIASQSDKLQTLIEALVKTSRLESGILTMHPELSEIAPAVERAASQYAAKAAGKKITLTVVPSSGAAVFDPKWMEEALCNLLDNAIKYTPAGGTVTVDVKTYELFSVIRVTDTGPGIPEREQAKIFSRFYRSADTYQTEGVGIGLYLTRQIAQEQGGYVKVESTPGKGSRFSLYLPLERNSESKKNGRP